MAEKPKAMGEDKQLSRVVMDSARQIWLAGLGAFSKAQVEGMKVFDALVKEGEAVEARTRKTASAQMGEFTKKASGTWDKLEQVFEDRVSKSLHRLGVPTHDEISSLSKQVAELNAGVKQLIKSSKPASRAGANRQGRASKAATQ